MVPDTWQSPSSPPPQRSHFSTASHLTSSQSSLSQHHPTLTSCWRIYLSLNSSSFPLSLFHTTPAHSVTSQVSGACNPIPSRNNHLRRLIILRHTSPPMLVTLWNKGQCGVNSRWCSCHRLSFLKISISYNSSFFCGIHLSSNAHFMITTSYSI